MSEWRERSIKRRDERHTKTPEPDPTPAPHSKKDRKRWCRGKVGIEHTPVWKERVRWANILPKWLDFVCTKCGRHLDYYYGRIFSRDKRCKAPKVGSTKPLERKKK